MDTKTHFIIHKKGLFWLLGVIVLIFAFIYVTKSQAAQPIYSCTQAFSQGIHDIKRGDKNYRPSLDRDSDGTACEE